MNCVYAYIKMRKPGVTHDRVVERSSEVRVYYTCAGNVHSGRSAVCRSAVQRSVRGRTSKKQVLLVVHRLNVAVTGAMSAVLCLVHATSLLLRQLSPSNSTIILWTSEATDSGVIAAAILYVMSHVLVLFAWSAPSLHGRLITRSTAVLGVSVLWVYSVVVACIPVLRRLVHVERELTDFHRGYVVYLVVQFLFAAVASALMMVSVVDCLRRGCNSSIVSRRFQTVTGREKDCVCRCVVALVVSAALWTPCVTFQLVDQLGCRLVTQHLESQVIFDIVIRQVSPLVGLSAGLLVPLIYCCRCPSLPRCSTRTTTAFYIS